MKKIILFISAIFLINIATLADNSSIETVPTQKKLMALEKSFTGKIGVYARDTNTNQIIAYRADERFPVQSTLKLMAVAALLNQSSHDKKLLRGRVYYTRDDLVFWHPVTGKYINSGMTWRALAEAAMSYSDNPAANLIIKKLGGPQAVTDFAHLIGNNSFNVQNYEGQLNSNPADNRDTATPADMALSLQKLTLRNVLSLSQRTALLTWMRNNTTGYNRIRAGVPIGWAVADKTGSGDYGVANDIGVLWSPTCKPIILAIYTVQNKPDAKRREDILSSTTSIVMDEFAKQDACFKKLSS